MLKLVGQEYPLDCPVKRLIITSLNWSTSVFRVVKKARLAQVIGLLRTLFGYNHVAASLMLAQCGCWPTLIDPLPPRILSNLIYPGSKFGVIVISDWSVESKNLEMAL